MSECPQQDVYNAWRVEGVAPLYHREMQRKLRENWPVLAGALDALPDPQCLNHGSVTPQQVLALGPAAVVQEMILQRGIIDNAVAYQRRLEAKVDRQKDRLDRIRDHLRTYGYTGDLDAFNSLWSEVFE